MSSSGPTDRVDRMPMAQSLDNELFDIQSTLVIEDGTGFSVPLENALFL